MAWVTGKSKAGLKKHRGKAWRQTPRIRGSSPKHITTQARLHSEKPGECGASVLYRDHVKGLASDRVTDNRYLQEYKGIPLPIAMALDKWAHCRAEDLPPVVVSMRRLKELWQGDNQRQGYDHWHIRQMALNNQYAVYAYVSVKNCYFLLINGQHGFIKRSCLYRNDQAKLIWAKFDVGMMHLEDISWNEFIPFPDPDTIVIPSNLMKTE